MGQVAFVSGATGFIGNATVKHLQKQGWTVYGQGRGYENEPICPIVCGDLDKIPWRQLPPIDVLFHFAGITDTTFNDPCTMNRVNVQLALNLFNEAIKHKVPRIVYASSASVYGNQSLPFKETNKLYPLHAYAESKCDLEEQAQTLPAIMVGLRYGNVYGPGETHKEGHTQSMVTRIYWRLYWSDKPGLFPDGEQTRDWVYIDDVARANLCATKAKKSDIFNIGTGKAVTFNEIAQQWKRFCKDLPTRYKPNQFKGQYQDHIQLDIRKAKRLLGFEARYDVKNGIAAYWEEIRPKIRPMDNMGTFKHR